MISLLVTLPDTGFSIDVDTISKYDDSFLNKYNHDTANDNGVKYCKNNEQGEKDHCLGDPSFRSIVAYKTNCQLGNHILAYMHLMYVNFRYRLTTVAEEKLKISLLRIFKDIDHMSIVSKETCLYLEFFQQFKDAVESLIARFLEEKSGSKVTLEKSSHGIAIYPESVAEKYGYLVSYRKKAEFELQLLKGFKANYTRYHSNCKYRVSCKLQFHHNL